MSDKKAPNGSGNWGGPGGGDRVWKPFTSGNQPSPAAKSAGHVQAKTLKSLAATHKENIIQVWLEVMNDPTQPAAARVLAADKLADRAEGKSVSTVDVNANVRRSITDFNDDDLRIIAGEIASEDGVDPPD